MINVKKEDTNETIIEPSRNINKTDSCVRFLILFSTFFMVVAFVIVISSINNHKSEELKNKSEERIIESIEKKMSSIKFDSINRVNVLQQKELDDLNKVSGVPRFQEQQNDPIDIKQMISLRQKIRDIDKLYSPPQSHELQKSENYVELLDDNNEDNIIDNIIKLKQELKKQKLKLVSVYKE